MGLFLKPAPFLAKVICTCNADYDMQVVADMQKNKIRALFISQRRKYVVAQVPRNSVFVPMTLLLLRAFWLSPKQMSHSRRARLRLVTSKAPKTQTNMKTLFGKVYIRTAACTM